MKKKTAKETRLFFSLVKQNLAEQGFVFTRKFDGMDVYANPHYPIVVVFDEDVSYGFWVFLRFESKPSVIPFGCNPHSWKYNFHSNENPEVAASNFAVHLETAIKSI